MKAIRFIQDQWYWYITVPLDKRRADPIRLLKKMAKIAGYKYRDCRIEVDGKPAWDYQKGWTQAQSDRYEKWFRRRLRHSYRIDKEWGMWNLMYGFRIDEKGKA